MGSWMRNRVRTSRVRRAFASVFATAVLLAGLVPVGLGSTPVRAADSPAGPTVVQQVHSGGQGAGYYAYYGGQFHRLNAPTTVTGSTYDASFVENSDGSVTVSASTYGDYVDAGLVVFAGTLKDLKHIVVTGTAGPYGVGLWLDMDRDGTFWQWSGDILQDTAGDKHLVYEPATPANVTLIDPNTVFDCYTCGAFYSLGQLAGQFGPDTPVAVWIGVTSLSGPSVYATITSVDTGQDVWVDADWSPSNHPVDPGQQLGYNAFSTIQAGVDAVAEGGTVHVAAGDYTEQVVISKPLHLLGAQAGVDARERSGDTGESKISGNGGPNITINASNVTVDGFQLVGPADQGTAALMMMGPYVGETIQNNIILDPGRAVSYNTSQTTFRKNLIVGSDKTGDGIQQNSGHVADVTIADNTFIGGSGSTNITFISDATGSSNVRVTGNVSTNPGTFVALFKTSDAEVSGNTVTGAVGSAIYIGGGNNGVMVGGNTVEDGVRSAVTVANIFGRGVNAGITITGNKLQGNATGVNVGSGALNDILNVHSNALEGNAIGIKRESSGGSVDATQNWWGSALGPASGSVTGEVTTDPWITNLVMGLNPSNEVERGQSIRVTPLILTHDPNQTLTAADVASSGLTFQYRALGGSPDWTTAMLDPVTGSFSIANSTIGNLFLQGRLVNAAGTSILESGSVALTWTRPAPPTPPVVLGSTTETVVASQPTTVTSADGNLNVVVPANTVPEGTTVTVAPLAENQQPKPGAGMVMIAGQVYEIDAEDPNGTALHTFQQPLHLSFTVDPTTLPAGTSTADLQIFYWDDTLKVWVPVPSTVDPATGTVTADVNHLTIFSVAAATTATAKVPSDVAGHWASNDILKLVALGAVSGYADGTFHPDANVSRVEFTKMLAGALKLTLPSAADASSQLASFKDAGSIPDWAKPYVAASLKAGYVSGYEDGTFRPSALVTRGEVAVIVARVLGAAAAQADLTFSDTAKIPAWAKVGVAQAVKAGIISGYSDGTFRPEGDATRGEVATMIVRLLVWQAKP